MTLRTLLPALLLAAPLVHAALEQDLGAVALMRGRHSFRLRLTGRRDQPDQNYALWFDAVALRPHW